MTRERLSKLVWGAGLALLATALVALVVNLGPQRRSVDKVIIGKDDVVYYDSPLIARQDALALGNALQTIGFFAGRAARVRLGATHRGTKVVSFAVLQGAWNHPLTISTFEEIGRRVAPAIGGFPIQVELADSDWIARKSLVVGKIASGGDNIYYFGSATEGDAQALAAALRQAGYLAGNAATVTVSKGPTGIVLGFVVRPGVWERPEVVAGFETLARRVAPSVGGPPLELRLLDPNMEPKKEVAIR